MCSMNASAVQLRTPGLHSECYSLVRIAGLWGSGFGQYWQGHFQQHHCSGRHPLLHHHSMSSMRHHFCSGWPLLAWVIPLPVQVVRAMHVATPLAYLSLRKAVCLCVSRSLCLFACLPACLCAASSRGRWFGRRLCLCTCTLCYCAKLLYKIPIMVRGLLWLHLLLTFTLPASPSSLLCCYTMSKLVLADTLCRPATYLCHAVMTDTCWSMTNNLLQNVCIHSAKLMTVP